MKPIRSKPHLAYVRSLSCAIRHGHHLPHICEGVIEPAHTRIGTDGGMGMKPGDNWVIPLCSKAHREQHAIGELCFQERYCLDMKQMATDLWVNSPHYGTVEPIERKKRKKKKKPALKFKPTKVKQIGA